jgi:two-component system NarL family response regulator
MLVMKIMVFDQHTFFVETVMNLIKGQPGIEFVEQPPEEDIVENAISCKPDIILMSVSFFAERGQEMMHRILARNPDIAFIILAPTESTELLLDVIRSGAKGYLPNNIPEAALLKSLYAVGRGEVAISRAMTSEIVSEFCNVSKRTRMNEAEKLNALTYREIEVLRLLAAEASNHEIGRELFISNNTVRVHVHNILEKLQTKNRREAAKFAKRLSISTNGYSLSKREREKMIRGK